MSASSRSRKIREKRGDFEKYLFGQGIDIGCGGDVLKIDSGSVMPYDWKNGNAQFMKQIANESFDFVYSSHCLEHLRDVEEGLINWIRILRPGGFLYIVVPDYTLYEHNSWPSTFNRDHKFSFSLQITRDQVQRDNHFHVEKDLIPFLIQHGIQMISYELEDDGYDYSDDKSDQTKNAKALAQICLIGKKVAAGIQVKE